MQEKNICNIVNTEKKIKKCDKQLTNKNLPYLIDTTNNMTNYNKSNDFIMTETSFFHEFIY